MGSKEDRSDDEPMHHREVRLPDGRYMIFYSFGESAPGGEATKVSRESAGYGPDAEAKLHLRDEEMPSGDKDV